MKRGLSRVALAGVLASGCYVGSDRGPGNGGDPGAEDAGDAAGSDGADGADGAEDAGSDGADDDGGPAAGARTEEGRWRRLTSVQYANAVQDLLGVAVDTSGFLADTARGESPFPSNAGVAPQALDIDIYWNAANAAAELATADLPAILDGCAPGELTCATQFIERFGARAFRRPLTDGQRDALVSLFETGAEDSATIGYQLVISAVLQAPQFLYITEFGEEIDDGLFALDGYEIATRLSLLLTNSIPDETLLAAAETLTDRDVLIAQAERLMQTDAFLETLVYTQLQLTHMSRLDSVSREEPEFDAALRQSMADEAAAFIREVMVEDGTIYGLFTTPLAFPDARLAADIYGFGGDGTRVEVEDGSRVGLLTLPAFLASSPPIETDFGVVYRGNAIRTRLLCDALPPPDADVEFEEPTPGLSAREILEEHQNDPACAGCHTLMDNIGFGLLNYDDLGRYAAEDADGPIDASGYVASGTEVAFDDAQGLAEVLATLPQLRACMTKQLFRFGLARDPDAADSLALAPVSDTLNAGDGNIADALIELIGSEAFVLRRGQVQ